MPQCALSGVAARVRRAVRPPAGDGDLVARFAADRDPEAFAELVRRHGPMVLAVCRRTTRHRQDAEDAYQAAFLVLARKVAAVNPPDAVAGWLFGVAVNVARAARRRAARRASRESPAGVLPDRGRPDPDPDDCRAVIDEEVARLPEQYRTLVVRCDLGGEPQAAVARQLGVPVGTVYSRLSTARRLLADRLRRRGVAAGAALAVPAADAAALPFIPDRPHPRVTELTEAVMQTGFAVRWKLAALALVGGVAFGVAREAPGPAPAPAPAPCADDPSRLVLGFGGEIRYLRPDGREVRRLTGGAGSGIPPLVPWGRVAPDGRVPLDTPQGFCTLTPNDPPVVTRVEAAKGGGAVFGPGRVPYVVAWTPDAKTAIGLRSRRGLLGVTTYEHFRIDLATGTATDLKLPVSHRVVDWSRDGAWFLTIRDDQEWSVFAGWSSRGCTLCKVSADGAAADPLTLAADGVSHAALSPDGKRVAYLASRTPPAAAGEPTVLHSGVEVVVLDPATGGQAVVASEPGGPRAGGRTHVNQPLGVRWSPDGSRVGFAYEHRELGTPFAAGWRVGVVGADGTGAATVFARDVKAAGPGDGSLTLFDWR